MKLISVLFGVSLLFGCVKQSIPEKPADPTSLEFSKNGTVLYQVTFKSGKIFPYETVKVRDSANNKTYSYKLVATNNGLDIYTDNGDYVFHFDFLSNTTWLNDEKERFDLRDADDVDAVGIPFYSESKVELIKMTIFYDKKTGKSSLRFKHDNMNITADVWKGSYTVTQDEGTYVLISNLDKEFFFGL